MTPKKMKAPYELLLMKGLVEIPTVDKVSAPDDAWRSVRRLTRKVVEPVCTATQGYPLGTHAQREHFAYHDPCYRAPAVSEVSDVNPYLVNTVSISI